MKLAGVASIALLATMLLFTAVAWWSQVAPNWSVYALGLILVVGTLLRFVITLCNWTWERL